MTLYRILANKPLFVEMPLWDEQRAGMAPDLNVDGAKEVDTGLVSDRGHPIMRIAPPIGFGRDREW